MTRPACDPRIFVATSAEAGQTLAAALRAWLPGESWSQIKQRIATRHVRVHDTLCLEPGRVLSSGERVEVFAEPLPLPPGKQQLAVRYVDAEVVVVEKPSGMTTLRHAAERHWSARRKSRQPALEEALAELLAEREGRREPSPLKAVHRIDRETSGLLVFARSEFASQRLIQQFARHTTQRLYLAIVAGTPTEGTLRSRLIRDRGDGLRGSVAIPEAALSSTKPPSPGLPEIGREAITRVRPLESWGGYALVECRLETGRTHQIRIQLAEAGHPLCGDRVYRAALGQTPPPDSSGATRVALHAATLGFQHPRTGEAMLWESPLPADMRKLVERLRT